MRVLLAPLDWGLGHAARCIPVIRELQGQGCEVLLAGSGDSLAWLKKEFMQLRAFELPGYQPRYPRHGSMVWAMTRQLPHFMNVIGHEHRAIENIIREAKIDIVISDNRYGCWSRKVPSVFITHQSNILMPQRFGWLQHVVRKTNVSMINRFSLCWIPDFPGEKSLAGDLISFGTADIAIRTEYIGWLSRFSPSVNTSKKYDVITVLSGPEPQRTILESILLPQLKASPLDFRVVRGLPAATGHTDDHRVVNFLDSSPLQEAIGAADTVIARSGFSTVMDLQALGKKAVFIPTPGQTEQEYLAQRLTEKGIALSVKQEAFNLAEALEKSREFSGFGTLPENSLLKDAVSRLLERDSIHFSRL